MATHRNSHTNSYGAWKRAVKALAKTVESPLVFEGDKDIGGVTIYNPDGEPLAHCEWDGMSGVIEYA